jgi:hypothetical protein
MLVKLDAQALWELAFFTHTHWVCKNKGKNSSEVGKVHAKEIGISTG